MAVGTPASDPPSASDGEKLALWRAQIAEDDSDDGDHPPPPPAPPRRTGPHSASGGGSGSGGGETEYLQRKVAVLQLQLEEKDLELQEARMQAQWAANERAAAARVAPAAAAQRDGVAAAAREDKMRELAAKCKQATMALGRERSQAAQLASELAGLRQQLKAREAAKESGGGNGGPASPGQERREAQKRLAETNARLAELSLSYEESLFPCSYTGERSGATGHETEGCETPGVPVSRCVDRSISNVTVPTLTPYLVAGATSAVVIAPGGAYKFLSWDREGTDIAAWLNSVGVSAFLLRYRVPSRAWLPFGSAPLMDAQRAIGLVREWAADGRAPGLNGSRVGVIGFSAGAHLAGHLSVAWCSRSYPRVDEADDRPCRLDFVLMIYPWESVTEPPVSAGPDAASALNVTSRNPPTFLTQTEDDAAHVEDSLYFYLALKKAGAAPSELHVYPEGGHRYGRCTKPTVPKGLAVCSWPHRAARFLQTLGVLPLL